MAEQQQQQQQHEVAAPPPPVMTRWSWNCFPSNRLDSTRMVVPLGLLYTPLHSAACELSYEPLKCVCGAILNPYCSIDYRAKTWGCPLCLTRNAFPPAYASMSETQRPGELYEQYATIEYKQPAPQRPAPIFAFVIDTCVDTEEELEGLKECILLAFSKMPDNARIMLITYGATVQLHDISGATEYPRSLVLRGNTEITAQLVKEQARGGFDQYVVSFTDAEFTVTSLIEELTVDAWPAMKDYRPLRCTGAAISAAAAVLEVVAPHTGSLVLSFISGVCTEGPGKVVDTNKANMIRHHADIRDKTSAASFWYESNTFYEKLMKQMVGNGHSLNVFVSSLDQVGVAEMKSAIQSSGGALLSAESWKYEHFRTSLMRFFKPKDDTRQVEFGLNATMDVITSPTWKVAGVIGRCVGTGKKSNSVAETDIGIGGTCQWTSCIIDSLSTFAIYFETAAAPPAQEAQLASSEHRYVQIITRYETAGELRTRVTTLKHRCMKGTTSFPALAKEFDQFAATVLIARLAVYKTDQLPLFDVLRWLDRTVIRLVAKFGTYQPHQPQSLTLPPTFALFPAFMYHLRRAAMLRIFNSSPDETVILRMRLIKAPCDDGILMIQPALYSYTMNEPPQAVQLDSCSILPNNILLLDTFDDVMIHHGDMIAAWIAMGYHEKPEYAYFAEFLEGPRAHARSLVESRYPTPRFFEVNKKDGNVRIMYNRINPSRTHNSDAERGGAQAGEMVFTDDVSLALFMDHLKKLAVSNQ